MDFHSLARMVFGGMLCFVRDLFPHTPGAWEIHRDREMDNVAICTHLVILYNIEWALGGIVSTVIFSTLTGRELCGVKLKHDSISIAIGMMHILLMCTSVPII